MGKRVNVTFKWTPSPSTDLVKRILTIQINDDVQTIELPPTAVETIAKVPAGANVSFHTQVIDNEGLEGTSVNTTFTVGDLVAPLPDTDLTFEFGTVEDDGEAPPG